MRVYAYATGKPKSDEARKNLLNIAEYLEREKQHFEDENYGNWLVEQHELIRKGYNLPNKIFSIERNKNKTNGQFVFFDKESDGQYYQVFVDDDGKPYIEVK